MLNLPTIFVAGAGAGVDIDMPVGDRLSDIIASKVDFKYDSYEGGLTSGDRDLLQVLRRVAGEKGDNVNNLMAAGRSIAQGIGYPRSIDAYLNAHQHDKRIEFCAKLAIAQTILEREKVSSVFVPNDVDWKFQNDTKVKQSWLPGLFLILQANIIKEKNLDKIFDNLTIINFNYDRCVEQYLFYVLRAMYQIDAGHAAELISEKLKIFHPYGQVGHLPWEHGSFRKVGFGVVEHQSLPALAQEIKTFNEKIEESKNLDQMRKKIAGAARIVFFGFHFHDQNMELLKPKSPMREQGRLSVIATAWERKLPELVIIERQIRAMVDKKGKWTPIINPDLDCKALFKQYATTLMS
jgi:hypothetical protein